MTAAVRSSFDRGTLRLDGVSLPSSEGLPGVAWDERTACFRAPGYRYGELRRRLGELGLEVDDDVARAGAWAPVVCERPPLRDYQEDAIAGWRAHGRQGVVVLPTGAGKTRVAVAAIASAGTATLVLCPTRALLADWVRELGRWYAGPVGMVGDGENRVEAVTAMTFASAYRRLDELGGRFELLVVDEAHHYAGGAGAEAVEMCVAPLRLGLTATAPEAGSAGAARLNDLIGPVVCEVGLADLIGTHLAPLEVVRLRVRLGPEERDEYEQTYRPFAEMRAAIAKEYPGVDWPTLARLLGRTAAGRAALAGFRRACAIASLPRAKRRLVTRLLERHHGDKALIFGAFTRDAYDVAQDNLVPVVTADVGRAERTEILERFRDGRYRAVVSARVLNEGIDVPDARVAILLGGTLGVREQVQRVGRVLRPGPGKRALVYELVTGDTIDDRRAAARWRKLAALGRT